MREERTFNISCHLFFITAAKVESLSDFLDFLGEHHLVLTLSDDDDVELLHYWRKMMMMMNFKFSHKQTTSKSDNELNIMPGGEKRERFNNLNIISALVQVWWTDRMSSQMH